MLEKIKAVVFGHAIGDALGVPVEFCSREELKNNPVIDMRGYGRHYVPSGTWSDDTSMSLCSIKSLSKGRINYHDVMENFWEWYYENNFTATGVTFDVGMSCAKAIENYFEKGLDIFDCGNKEEQHNGNGSLMRINPFALYVYIKGFTTKKRIETVHLASMITHAHKRSLIGCGIYSFVLWELLDRPCSESVYIALKKAAEFYKTETECIYYRRLFNPRFKYLKENEIISSAYIVDALEASIWCLLTTSDYKAAVLKAVNLGGDTDTIAAITGGLAGLLYGYDTIPCSWINKLKKKEYIEQVCYEFYNSFK